MLVSGPSPFADCASGGLQPASHVYPNAEVEPSLALNPVDQANLIGVYQQDRWSDGAARGIMAAFTLDGGVTWQRRSLPFSHCAGGGPDSLRAGDPWIVFGPTGVAWVIATATDGVYVAASSDKGRNWTTSLVYRNAPGRSADKPSIAADTTNSSIAYASWYTIDRAKSTLTTWFSRTADGGKTWSQALVLGTSQPVIVAGATRTLGPLSPMVIAGRHPDTLYVFTLYEPFAFDLRPPFGLGFQRSTDGGRTWSAPRIIQDVLTVGETIAQNNGQVIRTGAEVVNAATDPETGALYVVWQDGRFQNGLRDEVALSYSLDDGAHWSDPLRVNSDHGSPAVMPAIAVGAGGRIAISTLDWRGLRAEDTTTLPASYWVYVSPTREVTFHEVSLSTSFDMMLAPEATGRFVGDYTGLTSCAAGFCALFVTTNPAAPDNPTDVRFSTIPS